MNKVQEQKHWRLADLCSSNWADKAGNLLDENVRDIDIMYDNGSFFKLAIARDSLHLLEVLLQYFEKTKPQEEQARLIAQCKLRDILAEVLRSYEVSDEINKILKPYIWEDDKDSEQDLRDLDESVVSSSSTIGSEEEHYQDSHNNHHEMGFLGQNSAEHHIPAH